MKRRTLIAAAAALSATVGAAPVVHAAPAAPKVSAHCVYVGPVYVLGNLIIGVYEICEPA